MHDFGRGEYIFDTPTFLPMRADLKTTRDGAYMEKSETPGHRRALWFVTTLRFRVCSSGVGVYAWIGTFACGVLPSQEFEPPGLHDLKTHRPFLLSQAWLTKRLKSLRRSGADQAHVDATVSTTKQCVNSSCRHLIYRTGVTDRRPKLVIANDVPPLQIASWAALLVADASSGIALTETSVDETTLLQLRPTARLATPSISISTSVNRQHP